MDGALEQLLEGWRTNNRINYLLIERISDEGMRCTLSKRGGRSVALQFAHLHNVRVWQLGKRAPDLAEGLWTFAAKETPTRAELVERLRASEARISEFFEQCAAPEPDGPRRRGFKKGMIVHLGYFIAHESHHRGNILLTLKECGHNLDEATRYAIWNWDRI